MSNRPTTGPFSQRTRPDEAFFPNDVRLERIVITNGLNDVDVSAMLVSINIFEDLYSNTVTGSITLVDSVNLIGIFPFVGLEEVQVTFKTPGFGKRRSTELLFDVYAISDRNTGSTAEGTDVTQVYTLQLVSKSFFRNQKSRVRKAYSDMSIDEMVERITNNFLGQEVEVERTSGFPTYVIPGWTPFRTINWLSARARPDNNPYAANYLFFETVAGFEFKSFDSIVQEDPVIAFAYDAGNTRMAKNTQRTRQRQLVPELVNIRSYTILESAATMERIDQGMYASKLITHDIVTKQFKTNTFSYLDDFPRQNHVENKIADAGLDTAKQDAKPFAGGVRHGRDSDAVVKFHPKHSQLYDGVQNYDESEKWLLQRLSHMKQIEAQRIKIETPGLNFVGVGQVVVLNVPRPENIKGRLVPDDRDPEISGNYVITNIHHVLGFDDHKMVLELSKESLPAGSRQDRADIAELQVGQPGETHGGTEILTGPLPFEIPPTAFA